MSMQWRVYNWQSQKVGQRGEVLNRTDYRCGFCKGKGIISYNKAIRCPTCQGKGTVRILGLAVICAYCNATGRAYLNRDLTCNICKGKGVVPVGSKTVEICNECKGLGREHGSSLPCLKCKGKGVIPSQKEESENNLEVNFFNENNQ